ncbi:hypothetical protein GGH98_003129, partial [Coemansia sp. RSA 454]
LILKHLPKLIRDTAVGTAEVEVDGTAEVVAAGTVEVDGMAEVVADGMVEGASGTSRLLTRNII